MGGNPNSSLLGLWRTPSPLSNNLTLLLLAEGATFVFWVAVISFELEIWIEGGEIWTGLGIAGVELSTGVDGAVAFAGTGNLLDASFASLSSWIFLRHLNVRRICSLLASWVTSSGLNKSSFGIPRSSHDFRNLFFFFLFCLFCFLCFVVFCCFSYLFKFSLIWNTLSSPTFFGNLISLKRVPSIAFNNLRNIWPLLIALIKSESSSSLKVSWILQT